MRKPKSRPIEPSALLDGGIPDNRLLECQYCLELTTAFQARARFYRVGRCAKCNGQLRRARESRRPELASSVAGQQPSPRGSE